jgi:Zn-dependent protease
VVLHELGHALTARRFGIGTEDITLYPIGGVARLKRMPRTPGAELLIAIAGPLVNVVIAGVLAAVLFLGGAPEDSVALPQFALVSGFLQQLLTINLVLAGFNMIPAFPMDGGRILRALLSGWLGRLRATEIAAGLGKLLAFGFGIWCLLQGDPIRACLGGFIFFAAQAELAQARAEEHQRRNPNGDDGFWVAPPGYQWVSGGDGVWRLAPLWVVNSDQNQHRWL